MRSLYSCYRRGFREAVERVKGEKEVKIIDYPYKSPDKEKLSTEFIRISKPDAKNFLILTSGTVGLDYYIGSLVQKSLLSQITDSTLPPNTGVILVHSLNPWGASWLRPTNIHNIILNHNCFDPKQSLEDLEEEYKDLQAFRSHYKALESLINPRKFSNEAKNTLKSLWHTVKLGKQDFLRTLVTPQRHNNIGLNYGGLSVQREILMLKENIYALLPDEYEQVVYLDLQTCNFMGNSNVFVRTEDDFCFNWFKKNLKCEVLNENSHLLHATVISGLKESEDWTTGSVGIYAGNPYKRFIALRDENLFHNLNIWSENWSRGECDFWPISSYIESKYKQKLLNCYFKDDLPWQNQAINSAQEIIFSIIQALSRSAN